MKLIPTEEQDLIISTAVEGKNLAVQAYAGAAKTSTCVMIADALDKHSLYVAFNKSIAEEAATKFPPHVTAKTMHSLAYGAIVTPKYRKKLQGWFQAKDVNSGDAEVDQQVVEIIKLYCQSAYTSVTTFAIEVADSLGIKELDLDLISTYWANLKDENHPAKITHDVYLKLFQLSKPVLGFEVIYLDECLTRKQLVKTSTGVRSIESLYNSWHNIGNGVKNIPEILSYNIDKQIYEYKPMLGALKSENREVLRVKTEGLNKIDCTANHKILTQRGYIPAGELVVGEDYILLDSSTNQKAKLVLNDDQYQIMLGSLLGDGSVDKRSKYNTYRLKFTQGVKQYNYLLEKAAVFGITSITRHSSGYTGEKTIFSGVSKTFILEKTPWDCLVDMDERALAIWFMDDGSLSNSNNVTLHSNKYAYEEQEYLVTILKRNFNIIASIGKSRDYYCLYLNKDNGGKITKAYSSLY